jgi:5-methylcytosine-specific restriction endonuclease McrBC regulatory subunit McrC
MQQKIPIENLYYLLCYAWGVSDQLDKVKVDGEKCHSLENLLSMVLLNACDRLLRQGLLREYRFEEQEVDGVRGKLNLAETLKSGKHLNDRTICRLIWDSTLPCKDKDGRLEFFDFTEDEFRMNCIFERFLMNFCKLNCRDEYPEVHREYIDFQLSPFGMMFKEAGEALPMMETDVTLFNPNTQEKLILDAKFYREALVSKFGGREKVRRDHLSQILSYVMNQEDRSKPHTLNACGALVYPTVDEDFDFSYRYKETGHRIFVRTVNLGQPWRKIEERVKAIVKGEGRDEW